MYDPRGRDCICITRARDNTRIKTLWPSPQTGTLLELLI